jgi:hypothetical protein
MGLNERLTEVVIVAHTARGARRRGIK